MNKYNPIPFRSPNKIEHIYEETVEDVNGNKAIIKYCDYIDKNNKLITKYQLQVKWIEEPEEMDKKELDSFLKSYCSILDNCMLIYYDWYLCYHFIYKNELYFATIENNFRTYFIFKLKNNKPITEDHIGDSSVISYFYEDSYYRNNVMVYKGEIEYTNAKVLIGNKAKLILKLFCE